MKFLRVHVLASAEEFAIDPTKVERVSKANGGKAATIIFDSGEDIDVSESYENVINIVEQERART